MRILIVDDSKAMRLIVQRALRGAGFSDCTIDEAANGAEGLERIRATVPDLVLCDWNMPVMMGPQLLEEIKKAGINVPFGFVTSEGSTEFREKAKAAGALFVIAKPFTPENFKEVLGPILATAGGAK